MQDLGISAQAEKMPDGGVGALESQAQKRPALVIAFGVGRERNRDLGFVQECEEWFGGGVDAYLDEIFR